MRNVGLSAVLCVAVIAVLVAPSFGVQVPLAGATILGRGGTGVALVNEHATGIVNPAFLPRMGTWPGYEWAAESDDGLWGKGKLDEEKYWTSQIGFDSDLVDFMNECGLQVAASKNKGDWGVGLGYGDFGGGNRGYYAAFGKQLTEKPGFNGWFWGANLIFPTPTGAPDYVTTNIGLAFTNPTSLFAKGTWSFGLVGRDVLDEYDPFGFTIDAGLALTYDRCRFALDVIDLTDEGDIPGVPDTGTSWNIGGEYQFCRYFTGRLGLMDGDFTWGGSLRYNRLCVDYGWIDLDNPAPFDSADGLGIRYITEW